MGKANDKESGARTVERCDFVISVHVQKNCEILEISARTKAVRLNACRKTVQVQESVAIL